MRMKNQRADFFIPPLYQPIGYQRSVIVIHCPEHCWGDVEQDEIISDEMGAFIVGRWDFRTNGLDLDAPAMRDPTLPETHLVYVHKQKLGEYILHFMKQMISWFNETYVQDGLEQDLARYATEKKNDGHGTGAR